MAGFLRAVYRFSAVLNYYAIVTADRKPPGVGRGRGRGDIGTKPGGRGMGRGQDDGKGGGRGRGGIGSKGGNKGMFGTVGLQLYAP